MLMQYNGDAMMSVYDQSAGLYTCDQCDKTLTWEEVMVIGEMIDHAQVCPECYTKICRGIVYLEESPSVGVKPEPPSMDVTPVIKFKKMHPDAVVPTRATDGSAGFDLTIHSLEYEPDYDTIKIGCGVAAGIPAGYVGVLSVRSSTYKYGLELANQIGVIDSDYTEEIIIRLKSNGTQPVRRFLIPNAGYRIAQMTVVPFLGGSIEVDELPSTSRKGGDGSTGK